MPGLPRTTFHNEKFEAAFIFMKNYNKKNILIIGGAGFIGSHLSEALLRRGHKVVVIDDFSTASFQKNNLKVKIYKTDINNLNKVKDIFKKAYIALLSEHYFKLKSIKKSNYIPLFIDSTFINNKYGVDNVFFNP